jgi:hypothetical protein
MLERTNNQIQPGQFTDADLTRLLMELRAPEEVAPRGGFYARVMDRIESERSNSILSWFLEPAFGRRLAFAAGALMIVLALVLVSTPAEPQGFAQAPAIHFNSEFVPNEDQPAVSLGTSPAAAQPVSLMDQDASRDAVLSSLVTYQER